MLQTIFTYKLYNQNTRVCFSLLLTNEFKSNLLINPFRIEITLTLTVIFYLFLFFPCYKAAINQLLII